ncbi:hypothetical protein ABT117_31215 [Streptomyces sp. NPDC002262]|uniref:hypothetical protein n=1 Tax=Streptomyces sp. NPDC002262 TaxID=3154414 RepID=UPI00332D137E
MSTAIRTAFLTAVAGALIALGTSTAQAGASYGCAAHVCEGYSHVSAADAESAVASAYQRAVNNNSPTVIGCTGSKIDKWETWGTWHYRLTLTGCPLP